MNNQTTFKRLAIGASFINQSGARKGVRFRKISDTQAFELLPNGVGRVHAKIPFAKNHAVLA